MGKVENFIVWFAAPKMSISKDLKETISYLHDTVGATNGEVDIEAARAILTLNERSLSRSSSEASRLRLERQLDAIRSESPAAKLPVANLMQAKALIQERTESGLFRLKVIAVAVIVVNLGIVSGSIVPSGGWPFRVVSVLALVFLFWSLIPLQSNWGSIRESVLKAARYEKIDSFNSWSCHVNMLYSIGHFLTASGLSVEHSRYFITKIFCDLLVRDICFEDPVDRVVASKILVISFDGGDD